MTDESWDSKCKERQNVCLRLVRTLIEEKDKQLDLKFKAAKDALDASKVELDRRLEGLNHLRKEVVDDRANFLRASVYETKEKESDKWRADILNRLTIIETRVVTWVTALGFFFILIQVVLRLLE